MGHLNQYALLTPVARGKDSASRKRVVARVKAEGSTTDIKMLLDHGAYQLVEILTHTGGSLPPRPTGDVFVRLTDGRVIRTTRTYKETEEAGVIYLAGRRITQETAIRIDTASIDTLETADADVTFRVNEQARIIRANDLLFTRAA